jgi:uncharacterized protein (TIGR02246 family)
MGETLPAILAVRQLAERYAVAVDRGDGALFAAQFTEDGVLVAPRGEFVGRERLATVPPMMKERYEGTFHAVLTQAVDFDGERADGETYCIARHFFHDRASQRLCYEMTIRYQDAFRLTGGRWLISRRELVTDAGRTFPVDERRD